MLGLLEFGDGATGAGDTTGCEGVTGFGITGDTPGVEDDPPAETGLGFLAEEFTVDEVDNDGLDEPVRLVAFAVEAMGVWDATGSGEETGAGGAIGVGAATGAGGTINVGEITGVGGVTGAGGVLTVDDDEDPEDIVPDPDVDDDVEDGFVELLEVDVPDVELPVVDGVPVVEIKPGDAMADPEDDPDVGVEPEDDPVGAELAEEVPVPDEDPDDEEPVTGIEELVLVDVVELTVVDGVDGVDELVEDDVELVKDDPEDEDPCDGKENVLLGAVGTEPYSNPPISH